MEVSTTTPQHHTNNPSRQPPGHGGGFSLRNLRAFRENPVRFLRQNASNYGDVYAFRLLWFHAVQLNHPDDVRKVLVDSEGIFTKGKLLEGFRPLVGRGLLLNLDDADHRRQRRMIQPMFHRQRIQSYAEEMTRAALQLSKEWREGQRLDLAAEMNRLTLLIAARTLFGADLSSEDTQTVAEAMSTFARWYYQSTSALGPLLQHLPTQSTREFRRAKQKLDALISRIIAARRRQGDTGDIISMLVAARDAEGDNQAMSDEYIHDEAVTLLVAGHETTGGTLAWAFSLLAEHPEVADRLAAEVRDAIGDRMPTVADLPKLHYAEGVFAEALRLYPASHSLARQAKRPVTLGGYEFPAGTIAITAACATHVDPRYWEDPFCFRPERWTAEKKAERPKYAFYPFGGGARVCIGEAFAWMEGTLLLAVLASRWRAKIAPGHKVEVETLFTQRPKGGLPVILEARKETLPVLAPA
jgi:cytochrome P450